MKKVLSCVLLLTLIFLLAGCASLGDLSATNKIVVTKYTEVGEVAETVTVTEAEKIQYLCDHFSSLQLTRKDPSEGVAKTYELTFIARSTTLKTVFITSNSWLAFDGYTHAPVKGELDLAYIKGLFPCPFRWVGTQDGHHKHMLCDCCDESDVIYPHEDEDGDMYCEVCGYDLRQLPTPTNHFLRNQKGCEWLNEITAEDIAEIKIISGAVGVAPGNLNNISSSTDEAVIARIFEDYYWLDTAPISKMEGQIDGGGGVTVKFILKDGTAKELYINNGNYLDTNGDYFELHSTPKFKDTDNATKAYGFITYLGTGTVYDKDNNSVCEIPIDELAFVEFDGNVDAEVTGDYYTVETEFGTLWFPYSNYWFYQRFDDEDNSQKFYKLVGKKLDELIVEYSTTE